MELPALVQPFQGGIYAAALAICVLFASVVAKFGVKKQLFLMAFLVVKVMIILCEWLLLYSQTPSSWFWLSLLMLVSFGPAPLLWRFALSIAINKNTRAHYYLKSWEIAIFLLGALLVTPLCLASQVVLSFEVAPWFGHLIHITMSLCIVLFAAQVVFYWNKAQRLYLVELSRIKAFSSSLKHGSLRILKVLLLLVLSNWLASLIRTMNVWFFQTAYEVTVLAILVEYSVMVAGLFYLFHGPLLNTPENDEKPELRQTESTDKEISVVNKGKPDKYAKSALDEAFRQRIVRKLSDSTNVLTLARDNSISLNKFATALGEKPYYVSQVLNQDLQTNFYEFVTDHRIKYVIHRLSNDAQSTILNIALDAGFNAKSTFNTAFKSRTGMTPSKFLASKNQSAVENTQ